MKSCHIRRHDGLPGAGRLSVPLGRILAQRRIDLRRRTTPAWKAYPHISTPCSQASGGDSVWWLAPVRTTARPPGRSREECRTSISQLTVGALLPFVTPFEHQDRADEVQDRRDRGAHLEGFMGALGVGH